MRDGHPLQRSTRVVHTEGKPRGLPERIRDSDMLLARVGGLSARVLAARLAKRYA